MPDGLLAAGFELIKQYSGDEQVRLKVVVEVPGSWFGGGALGTLTDGERKEKYEAQAVEYAPVREFRKAGQRKATKEPAIRFICLSDATDDANHGVAAGKEYPLAHRLLDQRGFRDNALLKSVLTHAHEICLILQKDQGVGLSLAWQLLRVLHSASTAAKLQVVSGQTKEGVWKEMHDANLPDMFRKFRSILAKQLEQRFDSCHHDARQIHAACPRVRCEHRHHQ